MLAQGTLRDKEPVALLPGTLVPFFYVSIGKGRIRQWQYGGNSHCDPGVVAAGFGLECVSKDARLSLLARHHM